MIKKDILSFTLSGLESEILSLGEKKFRASQLYGWLHEKRVTAFAEYANLPKTFIERLETEYFIMRPKVIRKLVSKIDGTIK